MRTGVGQRCVQGALLLLMGWVSARFHGTTIAEIREDLKPPGGAERQATVEKALRSQSSLFTLDEHCSADPEFLQTLGRKVGEQVRVYRVGDESTWALYTVSEGRDEQARPLVRMAADGRKRLGADGGFPARLAEFGPHPTLTDDEARQQGEFVERTDDDGIQTGLLILAPHGGEIEAVTDQQAECVAAALTRADKPVSSWRCKGWGTLGVQTAAARWHITSTDIHEASFPGLAALARRRFRYAVSFHGMRRAGVLIGGAGSPALKQELQTAISGALNAAGADAKVPVEIAAENDALGGSSPRNIVNRYCRGTGVQIEQSSLARQRYGQIIADAVAQFYAARL